MISVNVKLFAMTRDLVGVGDLNLSLPDQSSTSALMSALLSRYPQLQPWRHHLRIAVNNEYVGDNHLLRNADEVAVIPPVSGG